MYFTPSLSQYSYTTNLLVLYLSQTLNLKKKTTIIIALKCETEKKLINARHKKEHMYACSIDNNLPFYQLYTQRFKQNSLKKLKIINIKFENSGIKITNSKINNIIFFKIFLLRGIRNSGHPTVEIRQVLFPHGGPNVVCSWATGLRHPLQLYSYKLSYDRRRGDNHGFLTPLP